MRAEPYDRLLVEIDYVAGHAPSNRAVDRLVDVVEDLCDKPGGVEVQIDDEIPDQGSPVWTYSSAQALETEWRDEWRSAEEGVAVIHALYLDGSSDRDSGDSRVLGYAYHGSSLVMFQETIEDAGSGLLLMDEIEPVVLAHEIGHLLGLVNNGIGMVDPHQDAEHGAHDVDDECIMYWAVETSDVVDLLLGTTPDFDEACRADVAAAKE